MSDLDTSHESVRALELLLPEAIVAGGSFAGWLPHPRTVPAPEREEMMVSARGSAVAQCIRSLLRRIGVDEDANVGVGEGGDRNWPAGFVGSLTHKGTVVLGVIAPTSALHMLGIDLERTDRDDLTAIETSIAPEGLPPGLEPRVARLLSFSAKEAVFKAQFPASRRPLGFRDIELIWESCERESIRAAVRCPVEGLIVRASLAGRWVVSAAISPAITGR